MRPKRTDRQSLVTTRNAVVTTKLPSTQSNVSGLFDMHRKSGYDYALSKLNMNRFLPGRVFLRGHPDERTRMGQRGRSQVAREFSRDLLGSRFVATPEEVQAR